MTEFVNPYQRSELEVSTFEVPAPIIPGEHQLIGSFPVIFQNGEPHEHQLDVIRFTEGGALPTVIAEWLKHRSHTDSRIITQTADDRYRFGNKSDIQEMFLKDQGGRRLYCAVDTSTGELSGVIWLHPLDGSDDSGALLVRACQAYNDRQDLSDQQINPAKMATLASRIYSDARHRGAHTPLLLLALEDYYKQWPDCEGVVIRVSKSDVNATGAFDESNKLKNNAPFVTIHSEDGVAYMVNRGLIQHETE